MLSRVTQLLERLSRVVEDGNLFDPVRPSLGSELEALRQRLEALGSGPELGAGALGGPAGKCGEGRPSGHEGCLAEGRVT